jgi:hypothetical protein
MDLHCFGRGLVEVVEAPEVEGLAEGLEAVQVVAQAVQVVVQAGRLVVDPVAHQEVLAAHQEVLAAHQEMDLAAHQEMDLAAPQAVPQAQVEAQALQDPPLQDLRLQGQPVLVAVVAAEAAAVLGTGWSSPCVVRTHGLRLLGSLSSVLVL